MGDGWETRRRRDVGPETHDAVMISFAVPADLQRIEIDTSRFVFNASPEVAVLGTRACPGGEHGWALVPFDVEVLTRTRIAPDARQVFVVDARDITALRVQAYPDGGIARVRAFGRPTEHGAALLQSMWDASRMLMTECSGLWRRTLLIDSDGSHDTSTGVAWLQGITAYVDTRGFAGRLSQHDDVFEWQRLIDIEPPGPFPDAGRMRWEADVLDRSRRARGLRRTLGPRRRPCRTVLGAVPAAARSCCAPVRNSVGRTCSGVVLGTVGGPQWTALNPHMNGDDLVANGVRWSIEDSEGEVDL